MPKPTVVPVEQWQQERDELLTAEKDLTRHADRVAAQRRRLPVTPFPGQYTFDAPGGPVSLLDLFGGQEQLAVYQFMDNGPDHFCPGCTKFTDNLPVNGLQSLADAGIAWATVSDMPLEQIQSYKAQKGWTVPFVSSRGTTFREDCGIEGGFMLTMFIRDGDDVYRTWNTGSRGVDRLVFLHNLLDLSVFGRQEDWEDSPPGWPQHPTYG